MDEISKLMKFRDPKTGDVFEDIEAARARACRGHVCDDCHLGQFNQGELYGGTCAKFVKEYPSEAARLMGLEVVEDKEEPMDKMDKPRIAWDKIGSKTAVWCKTEEDAKTFLAAAEERGLKWRSGDMPTSHTNWETNKEYTAYIVEPDGLMYSCCSFYKDCDYSIVPYEELLEPVSPRICEVLGVEVGEKFTYSGMIGEFWVTENGHLRSVVDDDDNKLMTCVPTLINHPDRILRKPRFTVEEVADAKALMRILGATGIERSEYGGNLCAVIGTIAKVVIEQDLFPSLRPGQSVSLKDLVKQ